MVVHGGRRWHRTRKKKVCLPQLPAQDHRRSDRRDLSSILARSLNQASRVRSRTRAYDRPRRFGDATAPQPSSGNSRRTCRCRATPNPAAPNFAQSLAGGLPLGRWRKAIAVEPRKAPHPLPQHRVHDRPPGARAAVPAGSAWPCPNSLGYTAECWAWRSQCSIDS